MKALTLFAAAATALILTTPVLAHNHQEAGSCPHHEATEKAVSQALTLLDQAKSQSGDQVKSTLDQARKQLTEAQQHMSACEEMCETTMKGGEAHADHSGHSMTPAYPVHDDHGQAAEGQAQKETTDPVCGMKVDPKAATAKSTYAGKIYYFCSKDDKEKFDRDPEKYLKRG